MPNSCWNDLKIIGPKEDLDTFCKHNLSFSNFYPIPESLSEDEHYNWCINNWGTKWDHYDMLIYGRDNPDDDRYDENELVCKFTTAWAPPINFLKELIKQYPRCWLKLTWTTEHNTGGVFVHYIKKGKPKCILTRWIEPTICYNDAHECEVYVSDYDTDTDTDTDDECDYKSGNN